MDGVGLSTAVVWRCAVYVVSAVSFSLHTETDFLTHPFKRMTVLLRTPDLYV